MKWPNFLKIKLPKAKWDFKWPRFFGSSPSFYSAWKRFIHQIPAESRSIIKSYQHFIVLGAEKSGKSELIQGLIDQSQDLYPFDTTYTEMPEVQFYIGPRQVIEEMSFATLENRSIKARKQVIRLWKRLYAKQDPRVVVAYDCSPGHKSDARELNKLGQLIAGKVSLLTEICKKPIKLRIALTHLDKIPGYLEFARFLKQRNLSFAIPLSSNFESNTLADHLRGFSEENLSLILTTVSHEDYAKILQFFKEMPFLFGEIEEFLRALVARVSFKDSIELDKLSLTSNQEGSTSFGVFQWTKLPSTALFFRYPMLKHQIGAGLLYLGGAALLASAFFQLRSELLFVKKNVELLDLLQFPAFKEQIVSQHERLTDRMNDHYLSQIKLPFFSHQLRVAKDYLTHRIRKHMIDPEFRKAILENGAEFKYIYFLGIMEATADNHLGKFVYTNAEKWAKVLGLDSNLIRTYVACSSKPVEPSSLTEGKASPFLPLTSLDPWYAFLKKFKDITDQPIFIEQPFEDEEIIKSTDKLLAAIGRLRGDPLVFAISTLLDEAGFKENENIKTVHWVGENIDPLENFLLFVKQTAIPNLQVEGLNLTEFFAKLKEITQIAGTGQNEIPTSFSLRGQLFTFDSSKWTNHVIVHNVERAIQEYMAVNSDTNGAIFFNNTFETPEPSVTQFQELFPVFKTKMTIPGRYSRGDFEKKVRSPAEKLVSFVESLPINPEEKKRFANFLTREAVNYIKNYQGKYAKFFDSYDVEADSLKGVKKLLSDLSKSTSHFYDFLKTVHDQTSVFSEPILSMKNPEELNEFAFLGELFEQKDGHSPIMEYQQLMSQILEEISQPALDAKDGQFSPVAKISMSIFHQRPDSYAAKLQECLTHMDVPERFHHTFNKPLMLVYKVGLQEWKQMVENLWSVEYYPKLQRLFARFPFQPKESVTASFTEIDDMLNPASAFYKSLTELISATSVYREGAWYPLHPELLSLDSKVYAELNRVSYLSNLLWDIEGKPKPLVLNLSSVPFSTGSEFTIPILAYVVAGGESLYNFNQDPSWQPISIEWWKADISYVGMEVQNKVTNAKSYRNVQAPAEPWSFFSLLKKGKQEEGNIWVWTVSGKEGKDARTVSFRFEKNPHDIFQPSGSL